VLAQLAHLGGRDRGQLVRRGQRNPPLRRHQHRAGQRGKGEVGRGEALADEVRTAVGEPHGHAVEGGVDALLGLHRGVCAHAELARDKTAHDAEQRRQRPALPGGDSRAAVLLRQIGAVEEVLVHPQPSVRAEVLVEIALEGEDLLSVAGAVAV
jgi:hypothetical protein